MISLKPIGHKFIEDIITAEKEINLRKINYRYPNSSKLTLKDLSLTLCID